MSSIYGTSGDETIHGTAGDDFIDAGLGDDIVYGGDGNDVIYYGGWVWPGPHDILYGEGGDDYLIIAVADGHKTDPYSVADGGSGNDTAELRFDNFGSALHYTHNNSSSDITCGRLAGRLVGIEQILFFAGAAGDSITGGTGNDQIYGFAGDDTLNGAGGNDILVGGTGADQVDGGEGDDILVLGTEGNDTFKGGSGNDTLDCGWNWIGAQGSKIDLGLATAQSVLGRSVTITGIENALGTNFADELHLGSAAGSLAGKDGNDQLYGGGGADSIDGGGGDDLMIGGGGNDTYYVNSTADAVYETTTTASSTNAGGVDTVISQVTYSIDTTHSGRQFIENLTLVGSFAANITGNSLANRMIGNDGANTIRSGSGNDYLEGKGGNDKLVGGGGVDTMLGGAGNDLYVIDNALDRIFETASTAALDTVDLGGIDGVQSSVSFYLDMSVGASFVEKLTLTGAAAVNAHGNALDNVLVGNGAANIIVGRDGADKIYGQDGNDVLKGSGGADWLQGGAGQDVLTGGQGGDSYVFNDGDFGGLSATGCDRITDYSQAGGDIIRLNLVDANTAGGASDDRFTFIGTSAFGHVAGELRYEWSGLNTYIQGDVNGDAQADFWIRLDGQVALTKADFVL
jgi:Ca2+-binding RTX toxin-like protein